jgi:hypothetical protein
MTTIIIIEAHPDLTQVEIDEFDIQQFLADKVKDQPQIHILNHQNRCIVVQWAEASQTLAA